MGKRVAKKDKRTFALALKAWREREGLTQSEAAKVLLVPSVRTLQNWEVARTMPQGLAYNAVMLVISKARRRRTVDSI